MDEQTALVLALQLVALFSIAGALFLYLICKIRNGNGSELIGNTPGAGKPVVVTSCDTAVGLQIAIHLANRGFRVFAGLKFKDTNEDTVPLRVIRSWQKHREVNPVQGHQGTLIPLSLDVTRDDSLHESVDIIRAHLPAGEDGIWAVINTSGIFQRGRLDQQTSSNWDACAKTNLVGVMRCARTFQALLRLAGGRIINFGGTESVEAGSVSHVAMQFAIEGASRALQQEFAPHGIKIITVNPCGILPDKVFASPTFPKKKESDEIVIESEGCLTFHPTVLTPNALRLMDIVVTTGKPKNKYVLNQKSWYKMLPQVV